MINLADWSDLGYRELSIPMTVCDNDGINRALALADKYGYQTVTDSSGHWIRRLERRKGCDPVPVASIVSKLTSNSFKSVSYSFIDDYLSSEYRKYRAEVEPKGVDQLEDMARKAVRKAGAAGYHRFVRALTFCPAERLKEFLVEVVLPAFFERHPSGVVLVISHNNLVDSRMAFLRALYTLAHYPIAEVAASGKGFATMSSWQPSYVATEFIRHNLSLANLLFYPYVLGFLAGPLGLTFQLCFSSPVKEKHTFPHDWMHLAESNVSYGRQKVGLGVLKKGSQEYEQVIHRRYRSSFQPSVEEYGEFLVHYLERTAQVLSELIDPCNFLASGTRVIDSVWAFENFLTVDRLLRNTVLSMAAREPSVRKNMVFECADIHDALRASFQERQPDSTFFKELFQFTKSRGLIIPILETLPKPVSDQLCGMFLEIMTEVKSTALDSVWLKTKVNPSAVMVKDRNLSNEVTENEEEFAANLIRALRNTHHGYLTKNDPRGRRPSRYLVLSTGNIPDSVTHLAPLWWISFVCSRGEFLKWSPLPVAAYD